MPVPIAKGSFAVLLSPWAMLSPDLPGDVIALISSPLRNVMTRSNDDVGIIVTVSVLVAAGVAAYQSPQVQQWVSNSRRKIAVALHNLGDEIHPRDAIREDISMTEEVGEAAEERRRIARAEIMRRAALLESRKTARESQLPLNSFDGLVDNHGNLRLPENQYGSSAGEHVANSTGIDTGAAQTLRRGVKPNDDGTSPIDGARLQLHIPSSATSNHPSESVVQFTPTSENPGSLGLFDPFSDSSVDGKSPLSVTSSSHTEGHTVFYAHPDSPSPPAMHQIDRLLADLVDFGPEDHQHEEASSAWSTAGSEGQLLDVPSDGTLSDVGAQSVGNIATPASWSEVGSVVSNDDVGHHQLH
ncbi:hypothetical protein N7492_003907 [Penicillium capsulatum]|uniref:Uncharacterized protein n=1 Tax=Penicillium capsulatum TaxID=69766 RepID=A0A9W9LXW5_9EURO|nr:hypothetical protein N7492_003907 [Penicillium capsulatum]KAJ6121513.1 hypothetical protein N7512_003978 [Penicillium capsulatum]